jgi:hypothetical protein
VFPSRREKGEGQDTREIRNVYTIFVGKLKGKRSLRRRQHKWKDNIKTYNKELGFGCVNWMHMIQDRNRWRITVNMTTNLLVPLKAGISRLADRALNYSISAPLH